MKLNLKDAMLKLDPSNDKHWTDDGLPRLETLSVLIGDPTLTREKINSESAIFCRSNLSFEVLEKAPEKFEGLPELEKSEIIEDSKEVSDEEKLHSLKLQLDSLYKERDLLSKKISNLELDADKLLTKIDSKISKNSGGSTVQDYLASQRKVLETRASVQALVIESGVNLAELQKAISPAPIDAARKRR
jgi:hypothetical protein